MNNLFKISDEILKKITLFILGLTYSISSISCSDSPTVQVIDQPLKVMLRVRDNNDERQLYIVQADGSELFQLTSGESTKSDATWSPDGSKIVFTDDRGGRRSRFFHDIHIITTDGTGEVNLTDTPDIHESQPTWSPDGQKIAYAVSGNESGIYVINNDGSDKSNLTANFSELLVSYPIWSPNGLKIAFNLRDDNYDIEIWVMNPDGTGQQNLTPDGGDNFHHVWSPDGSKIAFVSTRNVGEEIFVMNADGSNLLRLTNSNDYDARKPFWSPDGDKIVYEAWESIHVANIMVIDLVGFDDRKITDDMQRDAGPTWSPDGSKIAFYSNRSGGRKLHIMNADGTDILQINDELREDQLRYIPWSPVRR